jgi:hypothetical protein
MIRQECFPAYRQAGENLEVAALPSPKLYQISVRS